MTISATGYTDEYYELELSADLEEVDNSITPPPDPSGGAISFGFYFLAIAFLSGIILIIFKKGKISRKTE
jgi:hypothetical protein